MNEKDLGLSYLNEYKGTYIDDEEPEKVKWYLYLMLPVTIVLVITLFIVKFFERMVDKFGRSN